MIHKIPVTINEETPEEKAYFDAKTYLNPPKTSVTTLYREHTLLVGLVVGALIMGLLAVYFQNSNYGQVKSDLSKYSALYSEAQYHSNVCKSSVEKTQKIAEEMEVIGERLLQNFKVIVTPKTARVVENAQP